MNAQSKNITHSEKKTKKSNEFWDWLIHGKGTVAEPWPTVEEVLAKKEVQQNIQKIHNIFNNTINHKTKKL